MNGHRLAAESGGERHPLVSRYLTRLEAALTQAGTPAEETSEIVADLDNHFAEAKRSGGSLSGVLERLGGVEELAEAYGVALALGVHFESNGSWANRVSHWGMTAARASLVAVIGLLGLGFCLAGLVAMPAALILPFVPANFLDPTLRFGAPQIVMMLGALLSLAVGWLLLRLVKLNLRALALGRGRRSSAAQPGMDDIVDETRPLAAVAQPAIESWKRSES